MIRETDAMKKQIAVLLIAALVLSAAGCAAEAKAPAPTAEAVSTPEVRPETPSPAAEPTETETPESAAEGRLFGEISRTGEEFRQKNKI